MSERSPGCNAVQFAGLARALGAAAHDAGLAPVSFRSPAPGGDRRLRRHRDGSATVLVTIRDRPVHQVAADLIEGVLVAARRQGDEALRADLRAAVDRELAAAEGSGTSAA